MRAITAFCRSVGGHLRRAAMVILGWAIFGLSPLVLAEPASPAATDDETVEPDAVFDNLEIADPALNHKIRITRVGSGQGANNLLTVFAGLKNKTAHRVVVEVETIYKDKGGNALNTGSWIKLTLEPRQETDYRSSAISEAAVDYLVRVRRPPASVR